MPESVGASAAAAVVTVSAANLRPSLRPSLRLSLFALFALSGFSGLIYESIWSHYLRLFLGHAAYAQTLVLVIFMGGLALGSWFAARYGAGWGRLLLGYALVEGLVGFAGLFFHQVFEFGVGFAYESLLPGMSGETLIQCVKWGFAAALILPQSILLGATFPLMSVEMVRRFPVDPGGTIATLYFTNSLGAALGVLASGFVLIPWVGLPGTILTAALLNVLIAAVAWGLGRGAQPHPVVDRVVQEPGRAQWSHLGGASFRWMLLAASLLTGVASFMYEVGWLRMLSLVLGATTHAFEMMLSAFILGLALGSWWVRKRIRALAHPVRFLGWVQLWMGIAAMASLLVYGATFEWMGMLLAAVDRTPAGYTLFNLASHAIALSVMLPATVCAGMTFPLLAERLLASGAGERSIGQIYAANTVGAIVGVFIAVHLAMPLLGLKGLMVLAAAIDITLGIVFLHVDQRANRFSLAPAAIGLAAIAATLWVIELDPKRMGAGVYRYGNPDVLADAEILFNHDGKTSTVQVHRAASALVLTTNGKPDASIMMDRTKSPSPDEYAMVMLGALPIGAHPQAERAAVIGFGSGLTTHTLLASPHLLEVDSVEIEPAMVRASRAFGPRVRRAYEDPRSQIHIEDAKSFFSVRQRRYDLLVSEPSTAWVSGVSSLFTREFYRFARGYLDERGLFVQWIQLRETTPALLASVARAFGETFPDYVIYALSDYDILIIGSAAGIPRVDIPVLFANPQLDAELAALGLVGTQDIVAMRLGSSRVLAPLFDHLAQSANSDYFPVVDLNGVRARFMNHGAQALLNLMVAPLPVLEMLDPSPYRWPQTRSGGHVASTHVRAVRGALALRDQLLGGSAAALIGPAATDPARISLMTLLWSGCEAPFADGQWRDSLTGLSGLLIPYLLAAELEPIWRRLEAVRCPQHWTDASRARLALVRALSNRDAEAISRLAERSLDSSVGGSVGRGNEAAFLLGAAMLGHLADGRIEAARAVWEAHGGERHANIEPPLHLRLLELLSRSRVGP